MLICHFLETQTMSRIRLPLTCFFILLIAPRAAEGQFSGMKPRIPSDANTLVLINVAKLLDSDVADQKRWEARRQAAYQAGVSALPPDATEVVLAGRSDHEFGTSIWELGIAKLNAPRDISTTAARFGGTMDRILDIAAVRLPDDHYVVQLRPDMIASYTPANRQDVSRWLESTSLITAEPGLSPYLQQAFDYATKVGTPIIMAMDLKGTLSAANVKSAIESFESIRDANLDTAALTKLASGVQGMMLGITVGKQVTAAVRVDFDQSPQILSSIGKPLLIEVLRRQGASIEEMYDWTPSINGNTFLLQGTMTSSGMRRVMSVLELPSTLTDASQQVATEIADDPDSQQRIATLQYFQSITSMLDDLREKPKRDHVQTFGQAAIWYGKYARRIDKLPMLNVDDAMLDFGALVADSLRDAEAAMKGVGMRSSRRTAGNNSGGGGYSVSYGGYRMGISAAHASVREKGRSDAIIRGNERTAGAASVQQIWVQIDEETAALRREMTKKYAVEF
jgi:hypothetical protein